ncbi:hypothetical protein D3C78_1248230 [compost metagenome]
MESTTMNYLLLMWNLLMYKRRKQKFLRETKEAILNTVLDPETFFVYLSVRPDVGKDYSYLMLRESVYAMIYGIYSDKGLAREFYSEEIPRYIDEWACQLEYRGSISTMTNSRKYVYAAPGVSEGRRMYFLMGDQVYNRLGGEEALRLELSNMMFDVIAEKGQPDIKPVIFADGDRIVNLFTLKFEENS